MFEIHITTQNLNELETVMFTAFCKRIKVKPIIIELEEGNYLQQPMISKVVKDGDLFDEMERLKKEFNQNGYRVSRVKIEVPLESIEKGEQTFPDFRGKYFEWHGKVKFRDIDDLKKVIRWVKNVHLSSNSLKGENDRRFVTLRCYAGVYIFKQEVERLKQILRIK